MLQAYKEDVKIFILHHLPATDRKIKLQEDIKLLGSIYPIEWVEKFLPEDIDTNISWNKEIKIGNLSLLLKHQYVLEQIVAQNLSYGIVFEDDVDLMSVNNLQNFLEQSLSEINENQGDALWIGDVWVGKYTIPESVKQVNKISYFSDDCWTRCTHAYIISLNGAKIMLEEYNYELAIDHLFNHVKRKKSLKVGWTDPGLIQFSAEGKWPTVIT